MNEFFAVKYNIQQIPRYIMDLISLGSSNIFMRAGFVTEEDVVIGTYELGEYSGLEAIKMFSTDNILNIILLILRESQNADKHFIFNNTYKITPNLIYINKKISELKLVYEKDDNNETLEVKLNNLLEWFEERSPVFGLRYIENLKEYFAGEELNYNRSIRYIEELIKEVYLCNVN